MAHLHRFYLPPDSTPGAEALLTGEEAHHALHVVRARPGDPVALFDGQGREWLGTVESAGRRDVRIRIEYCKEHPQPPWRVTLVQAWLHREKSIEELIRRCTEIGVTRFLFFGAARSEGSPRVRTKWSRIAVESCKQCGRLWMPTFEAVPALPDALATLTCPLLIATADIPAVPIRDAVGGAEAALVVGPEGDFTSEELQIAQSAGAKAISLGSTTFRAEVAAMLGATLVLYEMGGFRAE